ncbi:Methyltransferase domain-containing protein [Actinopolymorpha cephalotaxi]|uniref:Methyltransferase domain-containing protein n=1 Tax=Actinopolymorpha cephalotaxi TaxID=504797 RepID=A0A1I2XWG9_9ACTN|nr:methyltransferase domain-containing protein [Actinopolymorpha cephalotaxi]NYH87163.1 SAM-dependent methyltransferase [Actinopolymorpha cephalotaxi]SFH16421.1 Methyltransferase domain-containing protein [Actinopolymorpha cephalotaxi]
MKGNTARGGRLNFDRVVDAYDAGRPSIPAEVVDRAVERIGLRSGDTVLEIGAATGQLTKALRARDLSVVALEPGPALRTRLVRHLDEDTGFVARGEFFEEYAGEEGPFAAIWSANAFHWVDPAVSYEKSARLLAPGGHLVLIWTYPILRDDLQEAMNASAFAEEPDFAYDPGQFADYLDRVGAEGREELAASGVFEQPEYELRTHAYTQDVDTYLAYLMSYGHVAGREQDERDALATKVRTTLGTLGVDRVELTLHAYTCVARRR